MTDRHPYEHVADLAESLAQMRRGEGQVIACPDCAATYDEPGHRPECPRHPAEVRTA